MSTATTPHRRLSPVAAHAGDRCFKCSGALRPYRRSGLTLELCEDCRGIFLDGGELERLIDVEGGGWSGRIGAPWPTIAETNDGEPISSGR
jgi:Zn-finger nucleic acid-binding protein